MRNPEFYMELYILDYEYICEVNCFIQNEFVGTFFHRIFPENSIPMCVDLNKLVLKKFIEQSRVDFHENLSWVIYADPPWDQASRNPQRGMLLNYERWKFEQVQELLDLGDCFVDTLAIWVTNFSYEFVYSLLLKQDFHIHILDWIKNLVCELF